ncbi:MAG: lamin tail domain-containing protein [bacterium]|nr:lamin tail domain-containing protein [bacterium]
MSREKPQTHRTVRLFSFILALCIAGISAPSYADTLASVKITAVQITGATAKDEFIEITNTGTISVQLEGWRLSRATAAGTISNLLTTLPSHELAPSTSLRIAHAEYTGSPPAAFLYSTAQSIAEDNSVVLYADSGKTIVDLVGFGTASLVETAPAQNPPAGVALQRKQSGDVFQDTDNNANDFTVAVASPEPSPSPTPNPTPQPQPSPAPTPTPSSGTIHFSEVYPIPHDTEDEWIEFEVQGGDVDLTGWKIFDAAREIHAFSGSLTTGFALFTFTNTLNNTGETLTLRNPAGDTEELVVWGAGGLVPKEGESIINVSGTWTRTTIPTKGVANQSAAPPPQAGPPLAEAPSSSHSFIPGDVVINEFMAAPTDDGGEWIELYNRSSIEIDLEGWKIEEGSERTTSLSGRIGTDGHKRFLVIEDVQGALNNDGDTILLRDPSTQIISAVTYGTWGGDSAHAAPRPVPGASTARKRDGQDSGNSTDDFAVTARPTKGTPNIVEIAASASARALIISELFPNPKGGDDGEFIELANTSSESVSLEGWTITDSTGVRVPLSRIVIPPAIAPRGFLMLLRAKTHIALNNTGGESVQLYPPNALEPSSTVRYTESAPEEWSYAFSDGVYTWTASPTPGKANIVILPNRPPVAAIDGDDTILINTPLTLDASDTQDPDGDVLTYIWTLPNGTAQGSRITMLFDRPGTFTISTEARDPDGANDTAKHRVTVTSGEMKAERPTLPKPSHTPVINEVLANPEGDDDGEFIELLNPFDTPIALEGVAIDDAVGGSRPWTLPEGTTIAPRGFLVLWHEDTGITLNNTGDSVRLLRPDGSVATEVSIPKSAEGVSFDSASGIARATTSPSPGSVNTVTAATLSSSEKTSDTSEVSAAVIPLDESRTKKSGSRVTVEGTVIAPSGRLGKYFYLDGLKVSYGSIPITQLAIGDHVRVTGTLGSRSGEEQLTLKAPEDLVLLGNEDPPEARVIGGGELDESLIGRLVQITGTLTRRVGKNLYITGDGDMRVYLAAPLTVDLPSPSDAATLTITGVVSKTTSGLRILPRSDADITTERVLGTATIAEESSEAPAPLTIHPEARARMVTKVLLGIIALLALAMAIVHYGKREKDLHQEKSMVQ